MVDTTTRESTGKWNGHRFVKHRHWIGLIVLLLVVGGIVGVAVASGGDGKDSSSSSGRLCNNKLVQMENSGAMQRMIYQHQNMLGQMRASLSPQMQQLMDDDPMWKSMRTGEFTQMFQDQQAAIDQMLGASSSCGGP